MRWGAILWMLCACGGAEPWQDVQRLPGRTEVVPIGTLHRAHRRSEDYPTSLVERMLAAARPEVVFVEVPPTRLARVQDAVREDRADAWTDALPEVAVAVRYAQAHGLELRAISGWSREAADDRRAYFEAHPEGPEDVSYRRASTYRTRRNEREGDEPEWVLGPLYRRLSAWSEKSLMTAAGEQLGAAHRSRLWVRHRRLFENAVREFEGKRIALVFGARDLFIFERQIADEPAWARIDPRGILAALDDW